jgi:hypothetical protein
MARFKVTYECPNPKCRYQDIREIDAPSKAAAWKTCWAPCPAHELSGDMEPVRVEEIEKD